MKHFFSILLISFISTLPLKADWVPFNLKGGHISIDIMINGDKHKAMLDTGAEMNAISSLWADKYGFRKSGYTNVRGVNGTMRRDRYHDVPVEMFGVKVEMDDLTEMSLGGHALLLGAPFFSEMVMQIDYPNQRLRIFPQGSIDMDKFKNLNIRRSKGSTLPAVEIEVNGESVWLTLDTGNAGGLFVKRNVATSNNWITENTEVRDAISRGANGYANIESFLLNAVKVGPYELDGVPVSIPAEGVRTNVGMGSRTREIGSKSTKGLLGYQVLKHFILTIDYSSYKAHIVAP